MPVVITDFTNRVWAVEQPNDGFIHVGFTGSPGPRLVDALDFITTRQKQFEQFVAKRRELEEKESAKKRRTSRTTLSAEGL
jgi:hypothetical protein